MTRPAIILVACCALSGCMSSSEIGVAPKLSPVGAGIGTETSYADAYPEAPPPAVKRFSLWDDRQSRLFTDPRALRAGDIMTVAISINDQAKLKNENDTSRTGKRTWGLSGAFDLAGNGSSGSGNLSADGDSQFNGQGHTTRSEDIKLSVAAVVTRVLPNGNLVIRGQQEVRVNDELRVLTIAGIVRPADIDANNTISYERIAEARISYGGRGRLSDVQQPSWGQQVADRYAPF
jgi:flagellar L-ring protein precursor FlgH